MIESHNFDGYETPALVEYRLHLNLTLSRTFLSDAAFLATVRSQLDIVHNYYYSHPVRLTTRGFLGERPVLVTMKQLEGLE